MSDSENSLTLADDAGAPDGSAALQRQAALLRPAPLQPAIPANANFSVGATDETGEKSLVPLEAVLCTEELNRRAARRPDYALENRALVALAQALADSPRTILQTLAGKILEVLGVGSAGISLLSEDHQSFFWPAIAGLWQPQLGGGTPRSFSPCGDVLDCNAPLLFKNFERRYAYFLPTTPPAVECLLVPFHRAGKAVGTIWAIAHDGLRKFDAEDLRLLESLGGFASAAYQAQSIGALEQRHVAQRLEDALQSGQAMENINAELLESEDALRRSEGELRDFVENAVIGLQSVGPDGAILWANQTQLDLLGYPREEYIGRSITDYYADQPVSADILARLTGGGTVHDHAARLRCKDGSIRHVLLSSNAFFKNGKFVHSRCFTRDVTQRKDAEEALRESQRFLRSSLDALSGHIAVLDQSGTILEVNAAWRRFADQNQFSGANYGVGASYLQHCGPAFPQAGNAPDCASGINDVISGRQAQFELEYPCHSPTEPRWFVMRATRFQSPGPVRVVIVHDDITERKQAEVALRQSEAFSRSIIESSPDCIKVLDLEGNLLSMQSGQQLLGIDDIRPFLHKSWLEFWDGGDRTAAQAAFEAARAGGAGKFVGYFRTLRGEPKWWDVSITPIFGSAGEPTRLLVVSRDVTQRRRAELNFEFLATVSHDLVTWASVEEMTRTVGARIGAYLNLSLCAFVEVNEAADQVVIFHDWHRPDVPGLVGVYRLADFVQEEFIRGARAGETIVVRDTLHDTRTGHETFAALKIASFICVPLIRDRQWRFAMCLYHCAPYDWREDEIELARELTARIWTRLERLRAEEALRQSEQRYRTLFETIDEGLCVIEMIYDDHEQAVDYRFLEGNPSFERHTGMHDTIGKRVRELIPEIETYWIELYAKVALTGEPVRFVNLVKGLGDRWLDVYASRLGGPGSRKVAVLFTNITERKKAEIALLDSEERYRNLFNSIDEGFGIIEMLFDEDDKPVDYRFLEVNPSFEKQTGLRDAVGKRMLELLPDTEAHWFETYGKVALTGEPIRFVNEFKSMGRWFDAYALRVGAPENRKVAVVFNDISKRKQIELNLNNAIAVAEKANLAKSDFLSSMSHELRTPLSAILGFAQLMESGTPAPTVSQQRSIGQILQAGWYLLELINEILDLALIESGKLSLTVEPMSLAEAMRECEAMVEQQAQKRAIGLRFPGFADPCFVDADRTRLKQILINLLSNAIKYNRVGGTVTVSCNTGTRGRIRILVEDTGEGLGPEKLEQLFQPFNRLGQEVMASEGTGIGLVMTKRLVELMGGAIGVESTVGKGSVFWVDLLLSAEPPPVEHAAGSMAGGSAPGPTDAQLHTLLYIEDNPANLMLVEDLIARRPDMRLLIAKDGDSGIRLARSAGPDLILMDINLPGMSGLQALRVLAQDPATAHIPVLALSANAVPGDIQKGLKEGFFRYLTKPVRVGEFMETLDVALKFAKARAARANKEEQA